MSEKKIADFGAWESPLCAAILFQGRKTASNPIPFGDGVLFLLSMPDEANAQALMYCNLDGVLTRITPLGFSLRSRVHEYGGLPFGCSDKEIFYCNFKDQEIYRQRFDATTGSIGAPVQLTDSEASAVRYAELVVDEKRQRLLCVREDHRQSQGKASAVINALVAIPLSGRALPVKPDEQSVLFDGTDFVASPTLSTDGDYIAFTTWSHPNMPWDTTQIRVAQFSGQGDLVELIQVDAGQASSKVQPSFDADNHLYFLSDWGDYWNLVTVAAAQLRAGCVSTAVYPIAADCCGAAWELGKRNYALLGSTDLLISVLRECRWQLHRVKRTNQHVAIIASNLGLLEHLRVGGEQQLFYLAASSEDYPGVYRADLGVGPGADNTVPLYQEPVPDELSAAILSSAQHLQFSSANGSVAYGLLYSPKNPSFTGPQGQLPPLLVNIHGGPTGTARAALNPLHQFWTSRGFAVLDLNHRGSTGYGRQFRQLLYGQWGVVDIEDVVAAVRYLLASQQVAAGRIAIRGGSAGGYAVLASLAACDLFTAGTSYYGVSDLELLARDTHKFESRYLDQLIGPYPEAKEMYQERSPINKLSAIKAAVLILQGEQDKVVPPNQASVISQKLSAQNSATEFISFEEEGHGFRLAANQIRALEAELSFYRRNLLGLAEQ